MTSARSGCVAFVVVCAIGATAPPVAAHVMPTCAQMASVIAAMQGEVDGLRRSARRFSSEAANLRRRDRQRASIAALEAKQFTARADVEQARTDGIRRNLRHCSNADPDQKTTTS